MPAEVSAHLSIGRIHSNSYHGQRDGGRRLFCPSHMLVLVEGSRATWMVQECPLMGQRKSSRARIRPSSPSRLLAAALLGYSVITQPELVNGSGTLRAALEVERRCGDVRILPLNDEVADHVFEVCASQMYGVLTTLPGSSIHDRDLQLAAEHGLEIAAVHRAETSV